MTVIQEREEHRRYEVTCRFCGRKWRPRYERSALDVYCPHCEAERIQSAQEHFAQKKTENPDREMVLRLLDGEE
jgi:Zn finger protein HypA/HybF involved in hydrogenase expression